MAPLRFRQWQDRERRKLEIIIRCAQVKYWLSRTRDLIINAETYSYPAFRESFVQLRRDARKADLGLIAALSQFDKAMEREFDANPNPEE
jgi:hypothetical protein